jgi:DNA-binding NarL/FixJ family response regulator
MSVRIAIYCCNYVFGEGIKQLIGEDKFDIDIAINCKDIKEVIDAKPDLLVSDYNSFNKMSINALFNNHTNVLLLETGCTPMIENEDLVPFISKGVIGILPYMTDSLQFNKAVNSIVSGELWFDRKKLKGIISTMNTTMSENMPSFTRRETEILKLICKGLRNKEIMQRMNISEQAVKSHLNRLYKKTGVSDRLQLALYIVRHWPSYFNET